MSGGSVSVVAIYKYIGFLMLVFAILGVLLPLVPATPFLLVAAGCFAKSSEKWHRWLLENQTFGPTIKSWEENRCVNCRTKIVAILSMLVLGGCSAFFAIHDPKLRLIAFALMAVGGGVVLSLKTCEDRKDVPQL